MCVYKCTGRRVSGCLFAATFTLFAQVVSIRPTRVVDVKATTKRDLGRVGIQIDALSVESGHWAALIRDGVGTESFIVSGDAVDDHAIALSGTFDRLRIDAAAHLHLRQVRPRINRQAVGRLHLPDPVVKIVDLNGRLVDSFNLPAGDLEPELTGGKVQWVALPRRVLMNSNAIEIAGWFPSATAWYLEKVSERLTLVHSARSEGEVRTLEIDEAFRRIGRSSPRPDFISGRNRILWAVAAPAGVLLVGLSELPSAGPAYVAVFRPDTGRLITVLQAELPTTPGRQDATHNPRGSISPAIAAVGNSLIIGDPEMQVLAVYDGAFMSALKE